MDRALIEQHLAKAESHVARGEQIVAEQRERVAILRAGGHDARQSEELLELLVEVLTLHVVDYYRLRKELLEISGGL